MSGNDATESTCKKKRPRKFQSRWLTVFGALLTYTICEGVTYSFSVFYVIMLNEFQQSKAVTALAGALLMGLHELIAPITGSYINAFGTRVGGFTGGAILAISYFIMLNVKDITSLCINMGLCVSVGLSLGYLSAMLAIEQCFKTKIAFATGVAVSGSGLGVAFFPPLVEFLHKTYDWRPSCIILAAVCLNLMVAGASFPGPQDVKQKHAVADQEEETANQQYSEAQDNGHSSSTRCTKQSLIVQIGRRCRYMVRELSSSFKQLFKKEIYTVQFGRLCVANAVVSAGLVVPMIFSVHAAELKGMDSYSAAFLMSIMGIASSAGQCALGWLATKLPTFIVYVVSISLSGVATALMPLASDFTSYAVLCAIFGFMYGSYHALMSTLVVLVVAREWFTPAYGVYTIFQGIGDITASPLVGSAYDWLESYDQAFIVAGCFLTVPVVLLLLPELIKDVKDWRHRATTSSTPPVADSQEMQAFA